MLKVDERVAGPQPLPELVTGDDLAGPFEQRDQEIEGLVGQVQPAAGLAQLTRADVQFEDAEPDNPAHRFRVSHLASFGRASYHEVRVHSRR